MATISDSSSSNFSLRSPPQSPRLLSKSPSLKSISKISLDPRDTNALRQNGLALRWERENDGIALEAVRQEGLALSYVPPRHYDFSPIRIENEPDSPTLTLGEAMAERINQLWNAIAQFFPSIRV